MEKQANTEQIKLGYTYTARVIAETVVGESVVVIKKLLQMQVATRSFSVAQCVIVNSLFDLLHKLQRFQF